MAEDVTEIRIVGPQFSDPTLIVQWLREKYGTEPRVLNVGSHGDRVLEMDLPTGIRVLAGTPAYFEVWMVHEFLLDTADAILLMSNRISSLRRLNAEIVTLVEDHAGRLGIVPIVAANDPHGGHPDFAADSAKDVAAELPPDWPVFETTIGPFEKRLRWSHGAAEVWDEVVAAGRRRASAV